MVVGWRQLDSWLRRIDQPLLGAAQAKGRLPFDAHRTLAVVLLAIGRDTGAVRVLAYPIPPRWVHHSRIGVAEHSGLR